MVVQCEASLMPLISHLMPLTIVDALNLDARRVHDIVYRDVSVTHLPTCIMRRGSLRLRGFK